MLNNLKQIREQAGLNQSELARLSKVGRQTIIRIENQNDMDTKFSTWVKLADTLKVPLSAFNIQTTDCEKERKVSVTIHNLASESKRIKDKRAMYDKERKTYTVKQCNTELIDMVVRLKKTLRDYGIYQETHLYKQSESLIEKATELNRTL